MAANTAQRHETKVQVSKRPRISSIVAPRRSARAGSVGRASRCFLLLVFSGERFHYVPEPFSERPELSLLPAHGHDDLVRDGE
jgi:hypothetical protein